VATDPTLSALAGRDPRALAGAIRRLVRAHADGRGQFAAEERIATIVAEGMALADLLGRHRIHRILEAEGVDLDDPGGAVESAEPVDVSAVAGAFALEAFPVVPKVPFDKAVDSVLSRTPTLARTGVAVAKAYARWGFAAARSISEAVTARLQKLVARATKEGLSVPDGRRAVRELSGWSKSYSETVYRTNLVTAFTAGEFQEARKPTVSKFVLGFAVIGSTDSNTRRGRSEDGGENHLAAMGLVAPVDHAVWRTATPPYGYNCRHSIRPVTKFEARRKGWLNDDGGLRLVKPAKFAAFRPHPNFVANTAQSVYAGG